MQQAADPTMTTLASFNDASQWEVIRDVPVLTTHQRAIKDKDGRDVTVNVDQPRLQRILAILQQRLKQTGVVPRITEGHILKGPNIPEKMQPEVLGFTPYFRLGTFGPERRPAILTDLYFWPGKLAKAREYPFRSAEIYPYEFDPESPYADQLTGVALLKKDPALDMGILTYGTRHGCYHYSMESAEMDQDPTKLPGEPAAPPPAPPAPAAPAAAAPPAAPEGPDPEFAQHFDRCMGAKYPHMEAYYRDHVVKHYEKPEAPPAPPAAPDAAPAAAPPAPAAPVAPPSMDKEPELMSRETAAKMAQYERDIAEHKAALQVLNARVAEEEKAKRLALYERDLASLQHEGFDFDLKTELMDVSELTPDQFSRHTKRIRDHYRQAPVGPARAGFTVYSGKLETPGAGGADEVTPKQVNAATRLMDAEKLSYDQAIAKVTGRRAA